VSWLWPSKEDHPRMRDFNRLNLGTLMVPATERLWMRGLPKWRIIYVPPRLDDIRPWSLPNLIWKAMPPHGGGHWDKKREITMVTFGNFLRNVSNPNLFQRIPITFRGANSATLWMSQTTTSNNMWRLIPNSCLRSNTCMSWIMGANLWWGF